MSCSIVIRSGGLPISIRCVGSESFAGGQLGRDHSIDQDHDCDHQQRGADQRHSRADRALVRLSNNHGNKKAVRLSRNAQGRAR
jgi:hypothetical protein